ncbi:triose-phosphate isomerase [Candidatus Endolissoclinum faulkneri L5]|uniref:Triosephosphate isomerase n=1 Tax=Candidatus Endolissoclinum faulkneri L5 TaxID=1401328 RepID=V9TRP3_9PROT|nr:triose-phosphate isomerase [Candidatus Endolissoclinum faulkneri]AHC73579.1 triose-phosphate isomerase [Candidatus Endolissoclinum faulkneri L5]
MAPRSLIVGNWKMNMNCLSSKTLAADIIQNVSSKTIELAICPPFVYLLPVSLLLSSSKVLLGGQDCHNYKSGAHTGDIAPEMLVDLGCTYVILGHSERRICHNENNLVVRSKAKAAIEAGLIPIICVGETENERSAGKALEVVDKQIRGSLPERLNSNNLVVAYEPIWAIGTGRIPNIEYISIVHSHIRNILGDICYDAVNIRVLYGGSVKPDNAKKLMSVINVNGALVGSSSLQAADFLAIAEEMS